MSTCFDHPGTRSGERCLLGYRGILMDFPTLCHTALLPLYFCAVPLEAKGGKIRLQSNSKIVLTQTHFLMLHEVGWQPRRLWYVSAACSALPHNKQWWQDAFLTEWLWTFWHRLKRSQMGGGSLWGPICGSHSVPMRWGNGSSFKRCY